MGYLQATAELSSGGTLRRKRGGRRRGRVLCHAHRHVRRVDTRRHTLISGQGVARESVVHVVDARKEVALAKLVQGLDLLFA